MKISLANSQKETERIIRNLERGNEGMALLQLRELRKSAYNRYYRAARKFEETMPTGIDYQLQLAAMRTAKKELDRLDDSIAEIRDYIKHPENYSYKDNRAAYFSVVRDFQKINSYIERREAERETLRQAQREARTVEGVTLYNIRKSQKINALLQNVIYNNQLYNFDEAEVKRISAELYRLTGYNLEQDLADIFDTPAHYESGGGKSNIPIHDSFKNITTNLRAISRGYKGETLKEINKLINSFRRMAGQ